MSVAHSEKKGIVLARSSKVTPETKKRSKERRTETETRKLHYVMKLPCFIEYLRYYTKAMHYCRTLIIRNNYYNFMFIILRNMIVNLLKKTGNTYGTLLREALQVFD